MTARPGSIPPDFDTGERDEMTPSSPQRYESVDAAVDDIIRKNGHRIVLASVMGLGKANPVINAFYERAEQNPDLELVIATALTLETPSWSSELEKRFLSPFVKRVFGDYPDLKHVKAMRKNRLPANVEVVEYFHRPGAYTRIPYAQRQFVSANYTHIARDIVRLRPNVLTQLIAPHPDGGRYSLSSNSDVALDVIDSMVQSGFGRDSISYIGMVNERLPFMYGSADVAPELFDVIIDTPRPHHQLFGPPKMPLAMADHLVGLYASALIRDGGTLQIGIGNLGDGVVHALNQRQTNNAMYKALLKETRILDHCAPVIADAGGTDPFEDGLYGSTEMLVDGYIELYRSGVLKRRVYDDEGIQELLNAGRLSDPPGPDSLEALHDIGAVPEFPSGADIRRMQYFGILSDDWKWADGVLSRDGREVAADFSSPAARRTVAEACLGSGLKNGTLVHAGFFIGPRQFYDELREMDEEERRLFKMTSVFHVNQAYGCPYASQNLKFLQRKDGRFTNAALMITLGGAVISDGLEDGTVISGVGGQYNFVSMAHALPGARCIMMLRSTRTRGSRISSNILFNYGHVTIPRHLRDIMVTEYGIADVRGKRDWEVAAEILNITDSRFQDALLRKAVRHHKLPADYRIPDQFRNNYPERLEKETAYYRKNGMFPSLPFGTDFAPEELVLGRALKGLKAQAGAKPFPRIKPGLLCKSLRPPETAAPYLARMGLDRPSGVRERFWRLLVTYALLNGRHI